MAETRKGDHNGCPHEVIDSRDLKFYRNQGGYYWDAADDPFRRRDRIPFARAGLAELLVFSLLTFGPAAGLAAWQLAAPETFSSPAGIIAWVVVLALLVCGGLIVWFFRDPAREVPSGAGLVVSPADGTVVEVEELGHDEFIGGPAVKIGIFLSIFNVHLNRAPVAARVIGVRYRRGKFLNALRAESARENEQLSVRLQETAAPFRRYVVTQITGAIARRIVCWLKPGDELARGERFGMIKLGSRTELVLARDAALKLLVKPGDKVRAGLSVLASYSPAES
jgi:phosphatidylserine decarboxylase